MEQFSQKWIIVALFDEVQEGTEFEYTDFPLHVTLAGVFATDKTGNQLANELAKILKDEHAIKIEGDQKAAFGPYHNIPVMKVKKSPQLMALYARIYEFLADTGVTYNSPEYHGEGYQPHVTNQKSGYLQEGEQKILKSISLIDMYPDNDGYKRRVVKTIALH